jgi:hypothetical protein
MNSLPSALVVLLPSLPLIIVYLVGIILSSTKLRLYRKAAALGVAGFGCLLLGQLVRLGSTLVTLSNLRDSIPTRELRTWLTAINYAATALTLAGAILLLLAIFADRDKQR